MEGLEGSSYIKSSGRVLHTQERANPKVLSKTCHGHGQMRTRQWGGDTEQAHHDLRCQMVTGDLKSNSHRIICMGYIRWETLCLKEDYTLFLSFLWGFSIHTSLLNTIIGLTKEPVSLIHSPLMHLAHKLINFPPPTVEEPSIKLVNCKISQVFTACPMEQMDLGHFSPVWGEEERS